jgi:hypothetical protein
VLLAAELLADPLCDGLRGCDVCVAADHDATGKGKRAEVAVLLEVRRLNHEHPVGLTVVLVGLDIVALRDSTCRLPNLGLFCELLLVENSKVAEAMVGCDGVVCLLHLVKRQMTLITGCRCHPKAAAAVRDNLLNLLLRERGSARGEARHLRVFVYLCVFVDDDGSGVGVRQFLSHSLFSHSR